MVERQAAPRQDRRQLLELEAIRERLTSVDAIDVDQRAVALAAARRPRGPGHLIPGAQLAAADLGSRDVDVIGLRLEPAQAQEPVALRRDLERPGDLPVAGDGLASRTARILLADTEVPAGSGRRPSPAAAEA